MKKDKEIRISVVCPSVPNFIITEYGGVPIQDFSDDTLKLIAGEWLEELLKKARSKRLNK